MKYKLTKSGDLMHVHEINEKDITYGFISIQFKKSYSRLNNAEQVLIAFLEQLQHAFFIRHTTGVKPETFLQTNRMAITDYWQDADGKDWKVKGWTDGSTLAVFYIKNINAVPVNVEETFLNGNFIC